MERSRAAAAASEHNEVIDVTIASPRREGVATLSAGLRAMGGLRLVDDCTSCPNGVPACLDSPHPRVLLLDTLLLDVLDSRCLPEWRRLERMKVLLWCDEARTAWVERVVAEGFHGFLLTRDPPELVARAMRAVHRGELWLPRALLADAIAQRLPPLPVGATVASGQVPLTPREAEVVAQLRQGASNKEIARRLGIMEDTVKKHLQSVFGKLGVHRRSLVMLHEPRC